MAVYVGAYILNSVFWQLRLYSRHTVFKPVICYLQVKKMVSTNHCTHIYLLQHMLIVLLLCILVTEFLLIQVATDAERLLSDLSNSITRQTGFDAVMRVRSSTGEV